MTYRIGVDVGGTFTDFVLTDGSAAQIFKILSTPDDPSVAVLAGFTEMASAEGLALDAFMGQVDRIVHGTTVTTNAVLTGNIATTGLLATRGFRDALEMRRGIREELYNNKFVAPAPPVPRWRRHPVTERIDHAGAVVTDLDLEDVDAAAAGLTEAGVEAVSICFMHAYANPAHEQAAAARLRKLMPDVYISVSSEILPQVRFYERTSTTTLNAAVGPILKWYLGNLVQRIEETGFQGVLLVMQSNGGVTSPAVAAHRAATTLLSGPAAGPVAGLGYAAAQDSDSFITIDMGGTSFEASMVQGGSLGVPWHFLPWTSRPSAPAGARLPGSTVAGCCVWGRKAPAQNRDRSVTDWAASGPPVAMPIWCSATSRQNFSPAARWCWTGTLPVRRSIPMWVAQWGWRLLRRPPACIVS
jgi:N-methylhydantoinase A